MKLPDVLGAGAFRVMGQPGYEGYGGAACLAHVPLRTHALETAFWAGILLLAFFCLDLRALWRDFLRRAGELPAALPQARAQADTLVRRGLAAGHWALLLHLVCCKVRSEILLYLLQPCHLILAAQAVALVSSHEVACAVAVLCVPPQVGAILAIAFPDTSGLDLWLEAEAYWVQHVLITTLTPAYLLTVSGAYRLIDLRGVLLGAWLVVLHHWVTLEGLDLATSLNIDFMLCPTAAMSGAFGLLPPGLFWPSYRSVMCVCVIVFGFPLAGAYRSAAALLASDSVPKAKEV